MPELYDHVMARKSAGILLYRMVNGYPEVLLVHPGGPFYAKKDAGVWSVPKGEFEPVRRKQPRCGSFTKKQAFS